MSDLLNKYFSIGTALLISFTLISCNNGTSVSSHNESQIDAPIGVLSGNSQGTVFQNSDILYGSTPATYSVVDYGASINILQLDSNNNLYAGTAFLYGDDATHGGQVWINLGGNSYWQRLGIGPVEIGNSVNSIAIDGYGGVYAATSDQAGNVYKYESSTLSWNQIGDSIGDGQQITSMIIDNSNNNIFVGTSNGDVWSYESNAWQQLGASISGEVKSMAFGSGNLYAAKLGASNESGQVFEYNNNQWSQVGELSDGQINSIAVGNIGNVYAGTSGGSVWEFVTGGWVRFGDGAINGWPVNTITIDNNGDVYAGTESSNVVESRNNAPPGQVYKFSNGNWEQVSNLYIDIINYPEVNYVIYNTCPVLSLAVNSSGNIFAGSGGTNCNYSGIVYSYAPEGSSWVSAGRGALDNSEINWLTMDDEGDYYALTSLENVFRYDNFSKSWSEIGNLSESNGVDGSGSSISIDENKVIYVSIQGGLIWRYENANTGWNIIISVSNLYPKPGFTYNIASIADKHGKIYFAFADLSYTSQAGFVWQYDNKTESLTQLVGAGESGALDSTSPISLALDSHRNLYAGTGAGGVFEYKNESWSILGESTIDGTQVYSLAIDNDNVFAGTYLGGVYKYIHSQESWVQLGDTFLYPVQSITFNSKHNLYAQTCDANIWEYLNESWSITKYGNGSSSFVGASIPNILGY